MIPSNRNNPQHVIPQNALTVDKHITVYVLLAGMAGGLVLAVVVMVCCKVCLRKKKPLTRQHVVFSRGSDRQHSRARKYHSLDSSVSVELETSCGYPDSSPSSRDMREFDPDELLESGLSQSWIQASDNGPEDFEGDLELKELPKGRASIKGQSGAEPKRDQRSGSSSPETPPEVTSVVRRRSSVGIQRQASVCLSDEEDQTLENSRNVSAETTGQHKIPGPPPPREVTRVAAIVHRSCNDKPPQARTWDQTSVCSSSSQPVIGVRHYPFIHSHSTPDSRSTANMLDSKHGRVTSTVSLHGIPVDLSRVVDLEDYHYSRQQIWELAAQGATLLKDKSQSDLDVAAGTEGWTDDPSHIQQAASTEGGLLEQSLEQHQLEHLRSLLRRYSPVDEEDAKIWSKVRYNDTGSREDIREEVIEMISGESSDDSNSSLESEILKQQSRQLWELRATLEEEEDKLSDTQEIQEDPPEASDPQDVLASRATSFESNADVSCDDPGYECDESDYLQLPSHELRRHCYKSLLTKRLAKRTSGGESSFDSVESSSTDRTEGATTSFESMTDNTDSTGEGQTNRLQQMKADSGYKSMESNGKAPRLCRKQLQFTLEGDSMSMDQMTTMEGTFEEELDILYKEPEAQDSETTKTKSIETSKVVSFEGVTIEGEGLPPSEPQVHKKKFKSALKKHCTESDIQWSDQQILSDMMAESRGKTSVFQRFFRSGRFRYDQMHQFRDYSIDEKSDALFREFSRPDIGDAEYYRTRGARLHGHMRLHHRSLPSTESSSPHLPRTVLSPQLSIEEESCESGGEEKQTQQQQTQQQQTDSRSPREAQAQIPVICLSHGGEGQ